MPPYPYYQSLDPEENDPYSWGLSEDYYTTADRPEDQVIEAPTADPFTQGRAATNAKPDPYGTRAQQLQTQAKAVSADAMATLERALKNQQHVTAEQGIAAALLAVIPTIGGGIIGRSVGRSKLPEGTFGVGKLAPTGFSAGAQAGLEGGLKAADSYLDSFKPSKEQQEALLRMAEYKNREAQTLRTEANQTELAGLNAQQADSRMNQQFENAKELQRLRMAGKGPTDSEIEKAKLSDPNYISALQKLTTPEDQGGGSAALTPAERLAFISKEGSKAVSMVAGVENASSRSQNSDRLLFGDKRFVADLGLNREDGLFRVKDRAVAGQMTQKDADSLKAQGETAINAIRSIREAQEAFNELGVAAQLSNTNPDKQAKIGAAMHKIEFARKAIRDAYLTGSILGKGAATDQKMDEIEHLLVAPPITETNANSTLAKKAIFETSAYRTAKLEEMRKNILNTLQSKAVASGIEPRYEIIDKFANQSVDRVAVDTSKEDEEIAKLEAILAKVKGGQ